MQHDESVLYFFGLARKIIIVVSPQASCGLELLIEVIYDSPFYVWNSSELSLLTKQVLVRSGVAQSLIPPFARDQSHTALAL